MERLFLKWTGFLILMLSLGCSGVVSPNYIKDIHPYTKKFYANFGQVRTALTTVLQDKGWSITKTTDPITYEHESIIEQSRTQRLLIFAEYIDQSLLTPDTEERINIFIRTSADMTTEVEIRYQSVTSLMVKNIVRYKSDRFVEEIFQACEELLN
ncbi:MAG: hypothetical protein KC713_01880 [Candidatus Omnitrophica bacterium]|nr:hypothetical protein [Candidatus Omnitrophota bacterium]